MGDEFAPGTMFCLNLAREIQYLLNVHPAKVTIPRMLEQRSMTCFLLKDGLAPMESPGSLNKAYAADAMKKMRVLHWVREIRGGREDFSNQAWPDPPCQINLHTILAHKLELDPHMTARRLALSLGISSQTVTNHSHHKFGMKCSHLRWIPQLLDDSQKAESVRCARIILEALDVHALTNYQYAMAGDESWMMLDQLPSKMWALNRDHIDAIIRLSHQSRKTMVTVVCGANDRGLVRVLPEGTRLTSEYFKDQVLREICQGSRGSWRLGRPTPLMLH
jgi:hypothetical protein